MTITRNLRRIGVCFILCCLWTRIFVQASDGARLITTTDEDHTTPTGTSALTTTLPTGTVEWTVIDSAGERCMVMVMDAMIFDGQTVSPVPQSANVTGRTRCDPSNSSSVFELEWWQNYFVKNTLTLHFAVEGGNYSITRVEVAREIFDSTHVIYEQWPRQTPSVSMNKSMCCSDLKFNMVGFRSMKLQPFARLSGGTMGEDGGCDKIDVIPVGLYVSLGLITLIVTCIVAVASFKLYKCVASRRQREYTTVE